MKKFFAFIKFHWFGLIMSALVFLCMFFFALVIISPKQDLLKRGFIPCTEAMAQELLDCPKGKYTCLLKGILKNSVCDIGVIGTGISKWFKGEQPTPWSNYIFTPEATADTPYDLEGLEEFYQENPNLAQDMQSLLADHKKLEDMDLELAKEEQQNAEEK